MVPQSLASLFDYLGWPKNLAFAPQLAWLSAMTVSPLVTQDFGFPSTITTLPAEATVQSSLGNDIGNVFFYFALALRQPSVA